MRRGAWRGPVALVSGLVLAAAYVAGHYLAMRYAVEQATFMATAGSEVMGATPDDDGLAEDMRDVRGDREMLVFLVGLAAISVTCGGIPLPRLKGPARFAVAALAWIGWAFYPVAAVLTFFKWALLLVGDGGATGFPHYYAAWLPRLLLLVVGAAALQATGLVMAGRTSADQARESPAG
ncbi:hypothetical protein [Nonomuraea sp. SYSU D8015]|uniref:hypothetical protein n=1 Tax=Nonomuraea sp. SYSU D8015 TaxID=2593644 RepID=UPI001660E012|nr:hypothetical protein [Nonomuraea sp. SYSU D8015]